MSEQGELSNVVKQFMNFMEGKGQIPNAVEFALVDFTLKYINRKWGGVPPEALNLVDKIVALSVHEPAKTETVWQKGIRIISEGITQKVEVIQEQKKKIPIASWGKKK